MAAVFRASAYAEAALREISPSAQLKVEYFDVQGRTSAEIIDSLLERGPDDVFGIRRFGCLKWRIRWSWPLDKEGRPRFARAKARYLAVLVVPRLVNEDSLDPLMKERWRTFTTAIRIHEAGHLSIVRAFSRRIQRAIRARSMDSLSALEANSIAAELLADSRRRHLDYEARTDHGRKQGVVL